MLSFFPAIAVLAKRDGGCYQGCLTLDDDAADIWMGKPIDDDEVYSNSSKCYEDQCEMPQWYCDDPDGTVLCKNSKSCHVYGANPSNVISLVSTLSGITCAVLMPLIGALVDYSTKRKEVLVGTMVLLICTNLVQCFLAEPTWFALAVIQAIIGGGAYMAHQVCLFAYIPELSRDPADVPPIMASTKVFETVAILVFFVAVLGIPPFLLGGCTPDNDISGAVIGQLFVVIVGTPFALVGLNLIGKRPALHELAEGSTLATVGLRQVARTIGTLRSKYPNLMWFFIGYTFWEAATGAVTTITGQYIIEQLSNPAVSFANVAMIMIICIIPGALIGLRIADKKLLTSKQSLLGALCLFCVSVFCTGLFAHTPDTALAIYPIVPFIGISNGWIYPAQRNLLMELIPGGCEAEMMGFFQFCSMVISWLPPLCFIVISAPEALGTMRWALFIVPLLHLLGAIILYFGVDVEQGLKDAASTLHLRNYGGDEGKGSSAELPGVELTNVLADAESPNSSTIVAKPHSNSDI